MVVYCYAGLNNELADPNIKSNRFYYPKNCNFFISINKRAATIVTANEILQASTGLRLPEYYPVFRDPSGPIAL